MNIVTKGVILARTDYGEADRILTVLTPDKGKVRLMAKGVRKVKSKLAGGIELFSVSQITYLPGRGEIGTLLSARLQVHYGTIVTDIERTMFGYAVLKAVNKITEDMADHDYFDLVQQVLFSLDDSSIKLDNIRLWLQLQLLHLGGHAPNLSRDTSGEKLTADQRYAFSVDDMTFSPAAGGQYQARHIKLLRLALGVDRPKVLEQIQNTTEELAACLDLARGMLQESAHLSL